jgi:hypothetical protein
MYPFRSTLGRYMLIPAMVLFSRVTPVQASPDATPLPPPASGDCTNLPHADHPMARISNGKLNAVIFLPNKEHGYYRASRFDWAGIVGCASLNGHTFFGEWFNHYDPMANDAVAGPVEEFRNPTSELGYDEAAPGGAFVKIGIGVIQRVDSSPYHYGGSYPILDHGKWTVKVRKQSITFRQELHSSIGFAYIYEKVLSLDKRGDVLSLEHHLKNIGTKPIDTAIYDHDFFMLDNKATGPGMEIHLPFAPVPDNPLPDSAQIDGKTIRLVSQLQPRHGLGAYLTGYSDKISDYDILFEDTKAKIGVEQTGDSPISKLYLWATPKTVCPEAYIAIHVAPGKSQGWNLHYRFFTN